MEDKRVKMFFSPKEVIEKILNGHTNEEIQKIL